MQGRHAKLHQEARRTHRDTVVVQDPVLSRHKLEVDEVRSRPQHIVGNHSSNQLVLQMQPNNLLASQSSAFAMIVLRYSSHTETKGKV